MFLSLPRPTPMHTTRSRLLLKSVLVFSFSLWRVLLVKFWVPYLLVGMCQSFSLRYLWYDILPEHFKTLLFIFFRLFLLCSWQASTAVTTVPCCVVMHNNQTNICPKKTLLMTKDNISWPLPGHTQLFSKSLKHIEE